MNAEYFFFLVCVFCRKRKDKILPVFNPRPPLLLPLLSAPLPHLAPGFIRTSFLSPPRRLPQKNAASAAAAAAAAAAQNAADFKKKKKKSGGGGGGNLSVATFEQILMHAC